MLLSGLGQGVHKKTPNKQTKTPEKLFILFSFLNCSRVFHFYFEMGRDLYFILVLFFCPKWSITPAGGRELENTPGAGSPIIVCPKCV